MFSSIDTLAQSIHYSSKKLSKSTGRVSRVNDSFSSAIYSKKPLSVGRQSNIGNGISSLMNSIGSLQNAITYNQAQKDALSTAGKIYKEMKTLATEALDPLTSDKDRVLLNEQFETLRQKGLELNDLEIGGKKLFYKSAATTKYEASFTPDGKQDDANRTGTIFYDGRTRNYWDETRDLFSNSGKLTINHKPYGLWDRLSVFQDDPDNPIFDTGKWTTSSDFDKFIVDYGPGRDTTFKFVPQDSNGNGKFDNESLYLNHLQLTSIDPAQELQNQGKVKTNPANANSTELTIRVIASGSVFEWNADWENTEETESINQQVARPNDLQFNLNPLGFGLLREQNMDDGFPLISINTIEGAQIAGEIIDGEINALGDQVGKLSSNFTRAEIVLEAVETKLLNHEIALQRISDEGLEDNLLSISLNKFQRESKISLLTQARSVNQAVANFLL
jgi:flagellin-like hook-associated protein FlgL